MITKWFTSLLCAAAMLGGTLGSSILPAAADQAPDKGGPGVVRVSILEGSAVVQRGDSNSQVAAAVNAPLLPGDYISTGATSRAELQFDGYTAVRLGGNVQARITNNDPDNRQMQLADGTVEVGIVKGARPIQIDTPSITLRAQEAGDYRISISKNGDTWATARRGHAEISTPQRTFALESGKTLVARGEATDPQISYATELGYDSFDEFNGKRDQTMVAALDASPNLSPDIAGYDNLNQYGQWENVPDAGQAWVPQQSSDWAPYQNGNWSWEDGYGWTWVSTDPWGWAPYHYGRWTYANGYGWAWVPPAYVGYYSPQPAWSPALVGFFGLGLSFGGPGWGVSLGVGSPGYGGGGYAGFGYPYVGWYPLPPAAPFYPWYPGWAWSGYGWGWPGYGVGYGAWGYPGWGTRVVNVTNINNYYYRNMWHHGLSGTLAGHFGHGTLSGHNNSIDPHQISKIGTIHGALPVKPTSESLGFGGHTLHAPVTMSRAFESPRFASANHTLAARPSFGEQQRVVSEALGRTYGRETAPVSRESLDSSRNTMGSPGRENAPVSRENSPLSRENAPASGSWDRFNQERGIQGRQSAMAPTTGDRGSGFQRGSDYGRTSSATEGRIGSQERAPASDSWGRFSQSRGDATPSYSHGDTSGTYSRGSYPSYSHGDTSGSYSRGSYPSYSHGDTSGSYSRGSYPSYSHNSYPSYSHSSYPSSYNRGAPVSAPHPSGGGYGGNGGGHSGGGRSGDVHGDGGGGKHPPQQ